MIRYLLSNPIGRLALSAVGALSSTSAFADEVRTSRSYSEWHWQTTHTRITEDGRQVYQAYDRDWDQDGLVDERTEFLFDEKGEWVGIETTHFAKEGCITRNTDLFIGENVLTVGSYDHNCDGITDEERLIAPPGITVEDILR